MKEWIDAIWTLSDTSPPIFHSSGVLTVLALMVAISAYLRQVYAACNAQIRDILEDKFKKTLPSGGAYATEQIAILSETSDAIASITPVLFFFILVACIRLCLWSLWPQPSPGEIHFLAVVDTLFSLSLSVGFVMSFSLHHKYKDRQNSLDKKIRDLRLQ